MIKQDIEKFISDKQINISESEWTNLNLRYSQEELIDVFKYEILSGNIELPIKRLTEEDAEKSFLNLIDYKCNDIQHGKLTTRYEYKFDTIDDGYYIEETNIGNVASDYFQQRNRFECGSINAPSPVRTWANEKFLNGMLKALWSLKCRVINDNTFRTCLSLRKYVASQFKPAVAKSIYEKFNAENILDFSAGWGDRLCGFYASKNTKSYIGIDPNVNAYNGYSEQSIFYSRYVDDKKSSFICSPAEDIEFEEGIVDLVFTSPPYFNVERYSNDDTQSYKRYKKLDDWLNGFLFRAIKNSCRALVGGGYFIVNISDVYSGHRINHICDPMNQYIQSLGMEYQGVLGMRMAKRPNSKTIKDGVFIEPMWVWRKK